MTEVLIELHVSRIVLYTASVGISFAVLGATPRATIQSHHEMVV